MYVSMSNRLNQLQHHNSVLNRSLSQSQYEYDAYTSQIYNQSQHRYNSNSHVTPPPAYSEVSSPNAYSNNSRYSGGHTGASTPRSGSMSMNVTPNSSMTNGYGFRPSQPPPAPPPNFVGYKNYFCLLLFEAQILNRIYVAFRSFTSKNGTLKSSSMFALKLISIIFSYLCGRLKSRIYFLFKKSDKLVPMDN